MPGNRTWRPGFLLTSKRPIVETTRETPSMSAQTVSVTLPSEMLTRLQRLAKAQKRSFDDLVNEALLQYERQLWWEEVNTAPGPDVLKSVAAGRK
jgi:predicted transcriptional regulator